MTGSSPRSFAPAAGRWFGRLGRLVDAVRGDEPESTPGQASSPGSDRALVYRGPGSLPGCPESVADVLAAAGLCPVFVGPRERRRLDAKTLAGASLYVQPGGGDVDEAWPHLRAHADDVRRFVDSGGHYLGICLGAYLAGDDPGFDLLPGSTDQYIGTRGASVRDESDAVVTVDWAGQAREVYFQDGPYVALRGGHTHGAGVGGFDVVARYDNGRVAALVCDHGRGRVGVVGPHPEATADWFTDVGLRPPEPLALDLLHDLLRRMRTPGAASVGRH